LTLHIGRSIVDIAPNAANGDAKLSNTSGNFANGGIAIGIKVGGCIFCCCLWLP